MGFVRNNFKILFSILIGSFLIISFQNCNSNFDYSKINKSVNPDPNNDDQTNPVPNPTPNPSPSPEPNPEPTPEPNPEPTPEPPPSGETQWVALTGNGSVGMSCYEFAISQYPQTKNIRTRIISPVGESIVNGVCYMVNPFSGSCWDFQENADSSIRYPLGNCSDMGISHIFEVEIDL